MALALLDGVRQPLPRAGGSVIDTLIGAFMMFGLLGIVFGFGAWIADNHGDWLDRIPGMPQGRD